MGNACMFVHWVHTEEFTLTLVSGLGQQDSTVKKKDWEAYLILPIPLTTVSYSCLAYRI